MLEELLISGNSNWESTAAASSSSLDPLLSPPSTFPSSAFTGAFEEAESIGKGRGRANASVWRARMNRCAQSGTDPASGSGKVGVFCSSSSSLSCCNSWSGGSISSPTWVDPAEEAEKEHYTGLVLGSEHVNILVYIYSSYNKVDYCSSLHAKYAVYEISSFFSEKATFGSIFIPFRTVGVSKNTKLSNKKYKLKKHMY